MHSRNVRTRFFQTCLGVFQGGGCRGAAFAGALAESEARGVNFAGVAGTSAGSIVAALLGARATAPFIQATLSRLDFLSLLREPEKVTSDISGFVTRSCLRVARYVLEDATTVWEYHGLHSSQGIVCSVVCTRLRQRYGGKSCAALVFLLCFCPSL
jgi:predicted acylesterase/phospholipase RssA